MSSKAISSTCDGASAWPANAVPQSWVKELFAKMSRMWGSQFLDKWRDCELEGVKAEWGIALRKLSSAELRAGVNSLMSLKFPPSLPEFHALCKQMRLIEAQSEQAPQLAYQAKSDPTIAIANLDVARQSVARLLNPRPSASWAFKLLIRGTSASGHPLPYEVKRCAMDAITSKAGAAAVDACDDPEMREEYQLLRDGIIEIYRTQGKPLWETP